MDRLALLGWLGTAMFAALLAMLWSQAQSRNSSKRTSPPAPPQDPQRRIEMDRELCAGRLVTLVRSQLAQYIRTGDWWTDADDLKELLYGLELHNFPPFLDLDVNGTWSRLVAKSIALAKKRRAGTITPEDVTDYDVLHRAWEETAGRVLGPLPKPGD